MDTSLHSTSSIVSPAAPEVAPLVPVPEPVAQTGSDNLQQLHDAVDLTGDLKQRVSALRNDVVAVHKIAVANLRQELTALRERQLKLSVEQGLANLVQGYGMSWSDLARATGVTQQALRKWRQGGRPSPDSRTRLAELGACMMLLEHAEVSEPASWLALPIVPGYNPRRFDLFIAHHHYELIALARNEINPEEALSSLDPQWRQTLLRRHETFVDADEQLSIKRR